MTRKNQKEKRPPIVGHLTRTTGWDLAVAEYALGDAPSVKEVRRVLQEKRFTIKDSEASYRLINHWTELGLVEDSDRQSEEGWRRLNLVDLIWIKTLMEMRRFGMPLNALKIAKKSVFEALKKGVVRPDFEYAVAHSVLVKKNLFSFSF